MLTFFKKNWLKILVLLFVIEVSFFTLWVVKSDPYATIPFLHESSVKKLQEDITTVNDSVRVQLAEAPKTLVEELTATGLYFMLAPKGQNQVQSFVFKNGAFSLPDDNKTEDTFYSFSADGTKAAFFAIPEDRSQAARNWGVQAQLYVAQMDAKNASAFPALSEATMVDDTDVAYKQHPDVSDAGEVVYIGWDKPQAPGVEESNNWTIYLVQDGVSSPIANGFLPKWRTDDEIYFVKNDGIHRLNVRSGKESELVMTSSEILSHSNNRIDISDDGTKLAWTQPDLNTVTVYSIAADGSLTESGSFDSRAYWVSFSPSGNYLAVETTSITATGREQFPEAKIEFFDMATMKKVPELQIDFDLFNQTNMYMTDWVTI